MSNSPADWEFGRIPTTTDRALHIINHVDFGTDLHVPLRRVKWGL
ncbi:MAG TPA: hypothetical protein VFC82_01985 [Actinomycetaceae bacterium]|nr:hypothetical protein [Actinomycetaceae bacterium]